MLTDEQLETLAEQLPLIKSWVAAVEAELLEALSSGKTFSSVRLVPKRALRKWAEDTDMIEVLTKFSPLDVVAPRTVISPAQAEKILGKSAYAELAEYTRKESSGMTLAFK